MLPAFSRGSITDLMFEQGALEAGDCPAYRSERDRITQYIPETNASRRCPATEANPEEEPELRESRWPNESLLLVGSHGRPAQENGN